MSNILAVAETVGIWVMLAAAGIAAFYAYQHLIPQSWRDWLAGFKTKTLGVIVAGAPDVLNMLVGVQALGADWQPTGDVQWAMRGIGVAIIVLRMITDKEQS